MNKERVGQRGRKPKNKAAYKEDTHQANKIKKHKEVRDHSMAEEIKTEGTENEGPNCTWSLDRLVEHYERSFLTSETYSYVTMNIRNAPDRRLLMKIYKAVVKKGGFKTITAECGWAKLHEELDLSSKVDVFQLYKRYLFHYEKIFNKDTALSLTYEKDGVTIEDLDPNYLIPVKVFEMNKPEDLTQEIIDEMLKQDVCVIRNFENATNFNKKIFDPEYFTKEHPHAKIDIVCQDPEIKTFKRAENVKRIAELVEFTKYQKEAHVKDENGNIKFAVNIDIGNWKPQIDELVAKFPEEMLFCSLKDSLQYVRNHILGMTLPQMYIKVKGSWTGGHEENLRYRAINLNHGPDSSEWNCVGSKYCDHLREKVRDVYKTDIYKEEGLWYADVDFCLANKIPIVSFNQKEGDVVLLGPGCEHWVRGFGRAVQTAWNFGTFDKWQVMESIKRMDVNSNIKFSSIVPNWTLLLDLANHEIGRIDNECLKVIYKELKRKVEQDLIAKDEFIKKIYSGRKKANDVFQKELEDSNITQCSRCSVDTFNYFVEDSNPKLDPSQYYYYCLKCAGSEKMINKIKDRKERYTFYYKYEYMHLSDFFKRIECKLTCEDPSNYQDSGLQKELLIKAEWPQVRTKQDLVEENLPCLFYGNSKIKKDKGGLELVRNLHKFESIPECQEVPELPESEEVLKDEESLKKFKKKGKKRVQKQEQKIKEQKEAAKEEVQGGEMEFNSNPSVMAYDSNEESEYVAKNEDKHKKKRRKRANASKSSKKQEKSKKMKAALVNYADQDKSRVRTKELTAQQQNNCFKALEDFSDEGSLEKVSEKGDEEFIPSYM